MRTLALLITERRAHGATEGCRKRKASTVGGGAGLERTRRQSVEDLANRDSSAVSIKGRACQKPGQLLSTENGDPRDREAI